MTTEMISFMNQWHKSADAVLTVLLSEEDDYGAGTRKYFDLAAFDIGLTDTSFPPKNFQLPTWRAISNLRATGKAVHVTTVMGNMHGMTINPEWLGRLRLEYSELLENEVFRTNSEQLKRFGERYLLVKALDFAQRDLEANKDPDMVIGALMSTLSNRGTGAIEDETADAPAFFELFDQAPEPRTLSGIAPIDIWTGGGLGLGEVVGIVAPEKSRKTTVALDWGKNLAEQGASVAVFMLESTIDAIKARFVSMYGIKWLMDRGLYDKADDNNYPFYMGMSGRNLLKTRNGYKKWHPYRVQAINHGLNEFRNLSSHIRFYDRGYRTGGLSNIDSIMRVMQYDKRRYGTQMVILDHLQRIRGGRGSGIFDVMSGAVNTLEEHARKSGTSMVLLSQQNEATKSLGSEATIVGSKGDGGALGAAVDYLLKLAYSYTEETHVAYITLNMFLSRHGMGGRDEKKVVNCEPVSGLLLK